jgi:hypothetical protein
MPNCVISARLRAIKPGLIVLGGDVHIIVPPTVSVLGLPVGCAVIVVAHQSEDRLVAESITRSDAFGGLQ